MKTSIFSILSFLTLFVATAIAENNFKIIVAMGLVIIGFVIGVVMAAYSRKSKETTFDFKYIISIFS